MHALQLGKLMKDPSFWCDEVIPDNTTEAVDRQEWKDNPEDKDSKVKTLADLLHEKRKLQRHQ